VWSAVLQLRDLEADLEEERRQRSAAISARKKLEGDLKSLESQVDAANKMKEDALKQLKKIQVCSRWTLCWCNLVFCLAEEIILCT